MNKVQPPQRDAEVKNAHQGLAAKVDIREKILERLTPAKTVVFDAYAGTGVIYRAVWHQAAGYVGCDLEWQHDDREAFVADNRRVLRCLELDRFTCFDLDSFGSPWEAALIIAARRKTQPGERIGMALTEGTSLATTHGQMAHAMLEAAGVTRAVHGRGSGGHLHDELIGRAVRGVAKRLGGKLTDFWMAHGATGAHLRYLGVIIEVGEP